MLLLNRVFLPMLKPYAPCLRCWWILSAAVSGGTTEKYANVVIDNNCGGEYIDGKYTFRHLIVTLYPPVTPSTHQHSTGTCNHEINTSDAREHGDKIIGYLKEAGITNVQYEPVHDKPDMALSIVIDDRSATLAKVKHAFKLAAADLGTQSDKAYDAVNRAIGKMPTAYTGLTRDLKEIMAGRESAHTPQR
jgi:hypothetical protein